MFVRIDPAEAEIIKTTPGLERIAMRYAESRQELVDYAGIIEQARDDYARGSDDDLEIDDQPVVSVADEGVWVNAWVWVPTPDEDEDEDEEDDE